MIEICRKCTFSFDETFAQLLFLATIITMFLNVVQELCWYAIWILNFTPHWDYNIQILFPLPSTPSSKNKIKQLSLFVGISAYYCVHRSSTTLLHACIYIASVMCILMQFQLVCERVNHNLIDDTVTI